MKISWSNCSELSADCPAGGPHNGEKENRNFRTSQLHAISHVSRDLLTIARRTVGAPRTHAVRSVCSRNGPTNRQTTDTCQQTVHHTSDGQMVRISRGRPYCSSYNNMAALRQHYATPLTAIVENAETARDRTPSPAQPCCIWPTVARHLNFMLSE